MWIASNAIPVATKMPTLNALVAMKIIIVNRLRRIINWQISRLDVKAAIGRQNGQRFILIMKVLISHYQMRIKMYNVSTATHQLNIISKEIVLPAIVRILKVRRTPLMYQTISQDNV